MKTNGRKK